MGDITHEILTKKTEKTEEQFEMLTAIYTELRRFDKRLALGNKLTPVQNE